MSCLVYFGMTKFGTENYRELSISALETMSICMGLLILSHLIKNMLHEIDVSERKNLTTVVLSIFSINTYIFAEEIVNLYHYTVHS